MPTTKPRGAKKPLPDEIWQVGCVRLRTWQSGPDDTLFRPLLLIVAGAPSLTIRAASVRPTTSAQEIASLVEQAMSRPLAGEPGRPSRLLCAEAPLVARLSPLLEPLGIPCEQAPTPELMKLVAAFETSLSDGQATRPGFSDAAGVADERVGQVLDAAAEFYRRAPWNGISSDLPIELRYPAADGDTYFGVVMGEDRQATGLAIYRNVGDLILAFAVDPETSAAKPPVREWIVFGGVTECAFADVDAIERSGWDVAGPNAYPTPIVTDRRGQLRTPTAADLDLHEAALRAISAFVVDHLVGLASVGETDRIEATLTVPVGGSEAEVFLRYPPDLIGARKRRKRSTRKREDEKSEDANAERR